MLTLPIPLLINWLVGLLSLALLAGSILLVYRALRELTRYKRPPRRGHLPYQEPVAESLGNAPATFAKSSGGPAIVAPFILGLVLLLLSFTGRHLVKLAFPVGQEEPATIRTGTIQTITRPDGTKIHAEIYGSPDMPTLVLTHGWGTDNAEWYYAKRQLSYRFRLIFWDLPGLGESTQPTNRNFALEKMASDLHSVLSLAQGKPVVLVGHSIGGMINLTFCRLYPDLLGAQIAGIVQLDTSYTNPVRTTKNSGFSKAIQKPIAEPLLYAMIPLSPLVRLMNWLSYENGAAYLMNAHSSFAGSETRGQLDLVSRYQYKSSPAVIARGTLGMFHWDATSVLPRVNVPVLIIVGQQDTTTLPSASEYMQGTMPQAELKKVSPSAHYGLLEQNQKYDEAIAQFALMCLRAKQ